jgi:hypothetical protein
LESESANAFANSVLATSPVGERIATFWPNEERLIVATKMIVQKSFTESSSMDMVKNLLTASSLRPSRLELCDLCG